MAALKDLGQTLSRFVGERRKRRQLELELEQLNAMGSLDTALSDVGLTRSQIGPLVDRSGRSREQLDRMLVRLGFDADRFDSGNLRDMTWTCTTCADKPQCRDWLAGSETTGFHAFCPNSAELDRAMLDAAHSRPVGAPGFAATATMAAAPPNAGTYRPTADERRRMRAERRRRETRALLDGPF
jgi:uncharacterized protein YjiS (DUF1127 family)